MTNYSNQNIYNTTAGASMAVSQDKTVTVQVADVSVLTDFTWVINNNGWVKEFSRGGLTVRYNKSFNYWCSKDGRIFRHEDGQWFEMHPWKQGISSINGYQRRNERYYLMLENNHPNFHQKVFVHHIMAWCWIEDDKGSYKKGVTIVDHINGDSLDNSASNIQYLTKAENIAKFVRGEG